ncbi:MAG: DUF1854 domain-containing protein [Kiritimatiellae bacterium]|nr:DUF1854 domain-containing protein [Verrucomicrobiota bacterium]MBU4291728.1 DUF1854 domain-containing protein [Verrucomicrobiota bacterium]MCG2681279.1 DUF1854 domain-containing protein [Kiritimatiellia bacterium]
MDMQVPDTELKRTLGLAEAGQLRFLDPKQLRFFQAGATLRLTVEDDICWLKISVFRVFPLSLPARFFSVRDGAGEEIGMLIDVNELDGESRQLVVAELERRYMVSIIRRVLSVMERFGTVDWEVETHRGDCRFTTRDLRENVLRPCLGHYLLTDVENNRYEIQDLYALDDRSKDLLMRHL